MKIEKLTPEQELMIPAIRDEWLDSGLSIRPANRAEAELGVKEAYDAAGMKHPQVFIWLKSPMEGCIGSYMLNQVRNQVRDQVGNQVGNQVWSQVWNQVWNQVRRSKR